MTNPPLVSGTVSLMILSDEISRRRLGNGMFLVFAAGVVAGAAGLSAPLVTGQVDLFPVLAYAAFHLAIVAGVSSGYQRALTPRFG